MQVGAQRSLRFIFDIAVIREAILPRYQVVLAAPPDKISLVLESFEQDRFVRTQHVVHGAVPAHVRIPTGHKGAATGRTNRILTECVAERDGIVFNDRIEVRCHRGGIAQVTHHIAAPLVGVEDDDIRSRFDTVISSVSLYSTLIDTIVQSSILKVLGFG